MSKFDSNILRMLSGNFSSNLQNDFANKLQNTYQNGLNNHSNNAKILSCDDTLDALVRVRNPIHFSLLERNFDITHQYPFIRTVGIKCGLKEAIMLERMQEVEYVCAQSTVCALTDDFANCKNSKQNQNIQLEYQNNSILLQNNQDNNDNNNHQLSNENDSEFDVCANSNNSQFVDTLSQRYDGEGVTLCVMDTGVGVHLDLSVPRERIIHFEDFIEGDKEPYDDNGHGTFVTGVAVGNGLTSGGKIKGIASASDVVGLKVISKSGESGTFKILDGMQWLFDNFRKYNINVVCMSFGAEPLEFADPLKIGVEMLSRSGLICVVASGNSGVGTLKSPAISNEVISVGAVDSQNNVAQFTSRGKYNGILRPDVYADGVNVKGVRVGGTYSEMSGTSASAPYVAGACCLLCQKYKNLTPNDAKRIILSNCYTANGVRIFR